MAVNPEHVDLTHIEDVTDIKPPPTVAVSVNEHHFGPIGREGKEILLVLLRNTVESEPFGDRVFGRLGVGYNHATWQDYDLYWVDDEQEFLDALREWNSAQAMA